MKPVPGFRIIERSIVGTHAFLGVERRTVETPDGTTVERTVITHPGAVAIVPLIADDIILIEQYRPAADSLILEIPAGKLDATDMSLEDAAARELLEETGYSAGTWTALTTMWTAVGFSDERITIFAAEGLTLGTATPEGPEEHAANVSRIALANAVAMVLSGEITDSKTIAGIMIADAIRRAA